MPGTQVGTGLGPTLEFYTLLAHELQRKSLGMWRCDSGGSGGGSGAGADKPAEDAAHIRAGASTLPMQVCVRAAVVTMSAASGARSADDTLSSGG